MFEIEKSNQSKMALKINRINHLSNYKYYKK